MGCVGSKLEVEEEVVSICRERKRQLKLAVERRYALAEAHSRYCLALHAMAAAIRRFVARHSSPSSPFPITFQPPCHGSPPPSENVISNPMFLQQMPSEPTKETLPCEPSHEWSHSHEEAPREEEHPREEEEEEAIREREQSFGYFYMQMPPPMPSPQRDFGWDFFNPFAEVRPEVISGYNQCSDEDLRAVREQEGIPELEDEGGKGEDEGEGRNEEKKVEMFEESGNREHREEGQVEAVRLVEAANVSHGEQKGLRVMDDHLPIKGRELLEALKDIEDHFIRAYDSGKGVSKMLEANRVHLESGFGEIKENSTKLIQAITWHRSTSSRSSTCKSLVASGSKSLEWKEYQNDLFNDCSGMVSGSHSLTLGRLYAWEKKLYEEVKAGDSTRKLYEKKCARLRKQDVRGDDALNINKTRATVKDLYARILVAVRSAESISKRIEELRDEELQPQIIELLQGLMRTWKIMLEAHETQNRILSEVNTFMCPTFGKFCNDSYRLATLKFQAGLQNWQACLRDYVAAQKSYIEALCAWLSKFVVPEVDFCSKRRSLAPPYPANGPPLLMICHQWLTSLERLPGKAVIYAMKSFTKDVKALWLHQGEELQQKRKVDSLAKELERRILGFQKAENKIIEYNPSQEIVESDAQHQFENLTEKQNMLETLRQKLDVEKEKHHNRMQETQRIMLNGFHAGFSAVLDSLTDFSTASLKLYSDLVSYSYNAEKVGNTGYIEGSQAEEGRCN